MDGADIEQCEGLRERPGWEGVVCPELPWLEELSGVNINGGPRCWYAGGDVGVTI